MPMPVRLVRSAHFRLTHSYVLAEYVALAAARGLPRQAVLAFVSDIQDNVDVQVTYVNEALHRAALTHLQQRPDKDWSLCDAVSFLLMTHHRLQEALTTDHHFEQGGFMRLLK